MAHNPKFSRNNEQQSRNEESAFQKNMQSQLRDITVALELASTARTNTAKAVQFLEQAEHSRLEQNKALRHSGRKFVAVLVSGAVLVWAGVWLMNAYNAAEPTPPQTVVSSSKGGEIPGVNAGYIEATANTFNPLNLVFSTETHISGQLLEPYALELRQPNDKLVESCSDEKENKCATDPIVVNLYFTGSADGAQFQITVEGQAFDGNHKSFIDVAAETTHADTVFSGKTNRQQDGNLDELPITLKLSQASADAPEHTTISVRFRDKFLLSHPADTGTDYPTIRISVIPRENTAIERGPYFALRIPLVKTISSNAGLPRVNPWDANQSLLFHPITGFTQARSLVDETGQAQLTSGVSFDPGAAVPTRNFPPNFTPTVSYIDVIKQVDLNRLRSWQLGLSTALLSLGLTLVVEGIRGIRIRRRIKLVADI